MASATSSSRAVSLKMHHALAKVSFRIDKSSSVTEEMTLKKVELVSRSTRLQKGEGYMVLNDGTLNGLTTTDNIQLSGSIALNVQQTEPNVSCLIAPMNAAEPVLSFTLTVDIGGMERTFATASIPSVQWTKGNHYTYHITVNKMEGVLTDVKIKKWKTDASPNTNIGI